MASLQTKPKFLMHFLNILSNLIKNNEELNNSKEHEEIRW